MARYDEMKSRWLLPTLMRSDAFDDAMSRVVDEFGKDASSTARNFSVWDAIDALDEGSIDALAEELNILWYDKAASLEAKRNAIRSCKSIQSKLGTKWATEEVLKVYFTNDTQIVEWFDYADEIGEPNHFKIVTDADVDTEEEAARFLTILNRVKRKSAILDKIVGVVSSETEQETQIWTQTLRVKRIEARR